MKRLHEQAIARAFEVIDLDPRELGWTSQDAVEKHFTELFEKHGYIKAFEHLRRHKEHLKSQALYFSSMAD